MFLMTQGRIQRGKIHKKKEKMGEDDEFSYEHADIEDEVPGQKYSSGDVKKDLNI